MVSFFLLHLFLSFCSLNPAFVSSAQLRGPWGAWKSLLLEFVVEGIIACCALFGYSGALFILLYVCFRDCHLVGPLKNWLKEWLLVVNLLCAAHTPAPSFLLLIPGGNSSLRASVHSMHTELMPTGHEVSSQGQILCTCPAFYACKHVKHSENRSKTGAVHAHFKLWQFRGFSAFESLAATINSKTFFITL